MEIKTGNKTQCVTLLSKEGNNVSIDIDGRRFNVDVVMLQNGTCSILYNGNSYKAEMTKSGEGKHYTVNLNYSTYQIDMLDSQAKYMRLRQRESTQTDTITVPMPCKILKVYVKPGDRVSRGDTLFTMEAMKMQSNYKVGCDCAVLDVLINDGDTMKANDIAIKLELNQKKTL